MRFAAVDRKLFAVFNDELSALRWEWLFLRLLRRRMVCFGAYMNAYQVLP